MLISLCSLITFCNFYFYFLSATNWKAGKTPCFNFDPHTPTHACLRADASLKALHWVSWHWKGHYKLLMVSLPLSGANWTVAPTLPAQNYTIDLFVFKSVFFPFCFSCLCASVHACISMLTDVKYDVFVCAFMCVSVSLCLVSVQLFLWVIGILCNPFTHTDIEIIAAAAVCYLPQSCVCLSSPVPRVKHCYSVFLERFLWIYLSMKVLGSLPLL